MKITLKIEKEFDVKFLQVEAGSGLCNLRSCNRRIRIWRLHRHES